jgi:hypothetical protein
MPYIDICSAMIINNHIDMEKDMTLSSFNKDVKLLRSGRDQSGCSCKPVKIDKLSTGKMKSELIQNGSLIGLELSEIEKLGKTELIAKMKECLKKCPMCVLSSCECVKLGIECFAEVCGCIGKRGSHSQSCANPAGQISFDPDNVHEYRMRVIDDITDD